MDLDYFHDTLLFIMVLQFTLIIYIVTCRPLVNEIPFLALIVDGILYAWGVFGVYLSPRFVKDL